MTPIETVIKECHEEASLPESLVRRRVRSVSASIWEGRAEENRNAGVTTYLYITEGGYLQPGTLSRITFELADIVTRDRVCCDVTNVSSLFELTSWASGTSTTSLFLQGGTRHTSDLTHTTMRSSPSL